MFYFIISFIGSVALVTVAFVLILIHNYAKAAEEEYENSKYDSYD